MRPVSQLCLLQDAPEAVTWAGSAGLAVLAFSVIAVAASQQGGTEEDGSGTSSTTAAVPETPADPASGAWEFWH